MFVLPTYTILIQKQVFIVITKGHPLAQPIRVNNSELTKKMSEYMVALNLTNLERFFFLVTRATFKKADSTFSSEI
jgi:hypothetical protein